MLVELSKPSHNVDLRVENPISFRIAAGCMVLRTTFCCRICLLQIRKLPYAPPICCVRNMERYKKEKRRIISDADMMSLRACANKMGLYIRHAQIVIQRGWQVSRVLMQA
jgi:hypothetical protein